jgi:hypothetical protein
MKNKLKAFAILPIAASLVFFGVQTVTSSLAATEGEGETPATTGASADTIEDCEWYLDGVDSVVTLENTTGMEYVGDDYTLTTAAADEVQVYFSGTIAQDDRCSFYDDVKGAAVEVSWTGTTFTNDDPSDTSLDWTLGETPLESATASSSTSSLDVTYTKQACADQFTAGAAVSITSAASPPLTPASISNGDTGTFLPSATGGSATFAKCTLDAGYSVVLPGGRAPDNPGSTYSFTGPALLTTITVND